jgi:tetratricopeptide (TPR) repeat protein
MTSCRWFASALVLLGALILGAGDGERAASAQGQAPASPGAAASSDKRTTRELIDSATKHFQAGEYDAAISDFYAAYQKKPLPALLFNIAQAHRKAEHWQEALTLYERFMKDDPKSQLVPEAEAHSAAMRAKIDAQKASAEREAAERLAKQRAEEAEALAVAREAERKKAEAALLLAASRKSEKPIYKRGWFWGVIGGVVAAGAITAGVVIAVKLKEPASELGSRDVQF